MTTRRPHHQAAAIRPMLALLLLAGCSRASFDATSELPVRFEVCDLRGLDCTLKARFASVSECQDYAAYYNAICCGRAIGRDQGACASTPGHQIVCQVLTEDPPIAKSRCR
jgi:hypothetical protein